MVRVCSARHTAQCKGRQAGMAGGWEVRGPTTAGGGRHGVQAQAQAGEGECLQAAVVRDRGREQGRRRCGIIMERSMYKGSIKFTCLVSEGWFVMEGGGEGQRQKGVSLGRWSCQLPPRWIDHLHWLHPEFRVLFF